MKTYPDGVGTETVSLTEIDNKYKNEIEAIKNPSQLKRYAVYGGLTLGVGIVGIMFASQIITGAFALILAGVTAVGGWYGAKFIKNMDPVIQKKMANHKIKKMLEMAQTEKIETLENYAISIKEKLKMISELRKKAKSKEYKYQDKIKNSNDEKLNKLYSDLLNKIRMASNNLDIIYEKAKEQDKTLQNELKILREKQEFIKDTADIINFLEDESGKYMDELLAMTASNQIETEFNEILVSLENISENLKDED